VIGIINYGTGNIQSVYNAFDFLGANVKLIKPNQIRTIDALVLPGVGAFYDTTFQLNPYKKNLLDFLRSEKPFLGICVGLQYLFEESYENGRWKGLGFFKGSVKKLSAKKLPQIGWNAITIKKRTPLLKKIPSGSYVYYMNSYAVMGKNACATSYYGTEFVAVAESENVFATQFHPEKSGQIGLKILENFIEVVNQCS
jgi:imidazole glycerol-phosphate synthase subunit HisH